MKIQCDVCNKDEAAVFCTADEAALCAACDHRVHHANKLAGKHQRFSLLLPSPKQFPLCDICQERKAFLFCQQDRAILCRDCDVPIHKANEHTKNHNRFLLAGVKLSSTTSLYSSPQSSSSDTSLTNNNNNKSGCDLVPNLKSQNSSNKPNISVQPTILNTPTITKNTTTMATTTDKCSNESTSSISEYLIDMLPGWRVEDFLESSPAFSGFCKNVDEVMPIWDGELESNQGSFSSPQNMGIWVPQAPPLMYPSHQQNTSFNMGFGSQIGFKEVTNNETGRKWRVDDGCFTVPQISPPPSTGPASKRSRTFC